MVRVASLLVVLACAPAHGDNSAPVPTPACRGATWRAGERAFAEHCRGRTGHGVHGTCADWLRAYRRCESLSWERVAGGWLAVLDLFDCHAMVVELREEKGRLRVVDITTRSHLPMPTLPVPTPRTGGTLDLDLDLSPSPSPSPRGALVR